MAIKSVCDLCRNESSGRFDFTKLLHRFQTASVKEVCDKCYAAINKEMNVQKDMANKHVAGQVRAFIEAKRPA